MIKSITNTALRQEVPYSIDIQITKVDWIILEYWLMQHCKEKWAITTTRDDEVPTTLHFSSEADASQYILIWQ